MIVGVAQCTKISSLDSAHPPGDCGMTFVREKLRTHSRNERVQRPSPFLSTGPTVTWIVRAAKRAPVFPQAFPERRTNRGHGRPSRSRSFVYRICNQSPTSSILCSKKIITMPIRILVFSFAATFITYQRTRSYNQRNSTV